MNIGIVNISPGNVGSVASAFRFYGQDVLLMNDPRQIQGCDLVVLAGVGHFQSASRTLRESGFAEALGEAVLTRGKPVLGICLGMHLFADLGSEGGENPGLGWISGRVLRIESPDPSRPLRVPHMGWNTVTPRDETLFRRMRSRSFYFMHSYHFLPDDPAVVSAVTDHGGLELVAAVRRGNIYGVQFHPEKSQGDGLRLLRNLIEELS